MKPKSHVIVRPYIFCMHVCGQFAEIIAPTGSAVRVETKLEALEGIATALRYRFMLKEEVPPLVDQILASALPDGCSLRNNAKEISRMLIDGHFGIVCGIYEMMPHLRNVKLRIVIC